MIKKSKRTRRVLIYPKILKRLSAKASPVIPCFFNYSPPKSWLNLGTLHYGFLKPEGTSVLSELSKSCESFSPCFLLGYRSGCFRFVYQGLRPGRLIDVCFLWRTLQALPCADADESCVANASGNLCQSFLLSYGVRVGIEILLHAFKLARGKSYSSLLDLKDLADAVDQEDIAKLSDAVKELNSMRLMTQLNYWHHTHSTAYSNTTAVAVAVAAATWTGSAAPSTLLNC